MAETIVPSVRGRQRGQVVAALTGSAVAAGAAVGTLVGVALIPVRWGLQSVASGGAETGTGLAGEQWFAVVIVAIVVAGVALDALALATGRPAPLAVGKQVPRAWIDYFSPTTVAVLFGTRLGIGPATILSTWTWWSVTVAAGLLGLGPAVAAGAVFGLVRSLTTILSSLVIERRDPRRAMPRLQATRRPSWLAIDGLALVFALTVLVSACSDPTPPDVSESMATERPADAPSNTIPARLEDLVRPRLPYADENRGGPDSGSAVSDAGGQTDPGTSRPSITPPADGEPQHRASIAGGIEGASLPHDEVIVPSVEAADTPAASAGGPDSGADGRGRLAEELPASIPGFEPVDGPATDRFLTLLDAAELQPDPTEEVALLETRGFVGGWTRAFRSDANDVAVTAVYEFAEPTEAAFYLEDGLITIGGYGGAFFEVDGLPGVRGFVQHFGEDEGNDEVVALGAAFQAGTRWYLVYFVGEPETVTADVLVPVVAQQWESITGGASPADS